MLRRRKAAPRNDDEKYMPTNKLNDLDPKTWLKFQKSWFIHNPPPRKKG
ncbi:MAG: hypothetical protein HY258_13610, partial [Chloroflexi bacterium]|nr:hypothetical protein [Chloroflexota bacterium]